MKKLFKFFIPVVALVAYSCTTDTTEDLGVELGGGHTTIEVSLDGSRTYIAEAVGDKYPVYWSADDQISVDGVASNELTEGGSTSATFTFGTTLDIPYCVAYPAAPKGQVLFADKQQHTDGTFGDGVATMYGYSESGLGLTLNHLTGVLQIGITGEATLTKAQISTIDRAPIAGPFAIDFTTGKVTPTAESVDVINYSFGDGLALVSEAQYIHVAVPAGVYDELYVTLYDTKGGVMYATVKANDDKPLKAGNVRTFSSDIAYAANTNVFVVSSVATLQSFASQAATLEKDVLFVEDIDMTDMAWTPIEGYAGTINGNGYAIKGLTAPLFGTTNAKIKGLHLTGLDAEWTTYTKAGAFACCLGEGGAISHCSTEGKININNTTHADAPTVSQYTFIYGGLVGYATGATIEHCENNADITITSLCATSVVDSSSHLYGLSLGGVLGATELLDGGTTTSISYATNRGEIYYANTSLLSRGFHWVGGVFGQTINDGSLSAFHHCYNYGKLHTVRDCIVPALRIGGVFGDLGTNESIGVCDFMQNHADIDIHGSSSRYVAMVHGIGYTAYSIDSASDCLNKGDITVQVSGTGNMYVCGGILAFSATNTSYRMKNEGDITILPYNETTSIGGIIYALGLSNAAKGPIEGTTENPAGNSGKISVSGNAGDDVLIVGVARDISGTFTNVVNSGDLSSSATSATNCSIYGVGSLVYKKFTNVHNTGNITFSGTATAGLVQLAGVCYALGNYSVTTDPEKPSSNSGTIKCTGKALATNKAVVLGGYAIQLNYKHGMSNLLNKGNLICEVTEDNVAPVYMSGLARYINYKINDCENKGNLTFSGNAVKAVYMSGIGDEIKGVITDVTNSGKLSTTATHTGALQVGGIVANSFTGLNMLRVNNSGDLDINSEIKDALRVAGFWPSNNAIADSVTFTDCHNSGYINIVGTTTTTGNKVSHTGGFMGYTNKPVTLDGCSNSGKVVNGVEKGIYVERNCNAGYFCMGGAIGWCYNTDVTIKNGFTNSAKLHSKVNNSYATYYAALGYPVGGVIAIYHKAAATFDWQGEIKNTGDITLEGGTTTTRLGVGGIIGISNVTTTCEANLVNTGNIIINKETAKIPETNGFGGIMGIASGIIKNAKSFCNIEAIDMSANIGFITGSNRSDTVYAQYSHIGGKICKEKKQDEEDPDADDEGMVADVKTLNYTTFYQYIYGGSNDITTEILDTDKCGYISAIDATPVDYNGNPIVAE